MGEDPLQLYDQQAGNWRRRSPSSLSDFTARPAIFDLCGDVEGLDILDVGCGEGYCTRELVARGAASATGIDLSAEMVALAKEQESELGQGISYLQGDARSLEQPDASFDLVTAVFVFNYMTTAEMVTSLREMRRVLRPTGAVIFSVPHPAFPFMRAPAPPFFFDFGERGYFSGRDTRNPGQIFRIDGTALEVQMVHKSFEDYFAALADAGFTALPVVKELTVRPEDLEDHREWMGPLQDIPLHVAFRVVR